MNLCSDYRIRGCPASYYLMCPAYQQNKNCWEVPGSKPCCGPATPSRCATCRVRKAAAHADLRKEVLENGRPRFRVI